MSPETIEQEFKRKVCEGVRLSAEGLDRYRVFTPFLLDDGDHLAIVLKQEDSRWVLSDEGHTFMHLTYELDEKDLSRGTRGSIINNTLSGFSVETVTESSAFEFLTSVLATRSTALSRRC